MKYRHQFRLRVSIGQVAEFRRRSVSMHSIIPPPVSVRLHRTPDVLGVGNKKGFRMGVDLPTIRPVASIEGVSPTGFTGRQIHSPLAEWVHRRAFNALDNQDRIGG